MFHTLFVLVVLPLLIILGAAVIYHYTKKEM